MSSASAAAPTAALDGLRAQLAPVVAEARRTAPGTGWLSIRLAASPLAVEVVLHDDAAGETRTFVGVPTDGLAAAMAELLDAFLAALPRALARAVGAYARLRPEAVLLLADAALRGVHVLLDPGGDADLLELGTLSDERTH